MNLLVFEFNRKFNLLKKIICFSIVITMIDTRDGVMSIHRGNKAVNTIENLFYYHSCRDLLRDLFHSRRKKNPGYSMRKFCKDLGFSSPSHLSDVIKGKKNLGVRGSANIMNKLNLDPKERDYFLYILNRDQCKAGLMTATRSGPRRSNAILSSALSQLKGVSGAEKRICTVILALAEQYGREFRPDPLWISRRSKIPLDESNAARSLDFLQSQGVLVNEGGGFKVSEYCGRSAVDSENQDQLADALQSLKETQNLLKGQDVNSIFTNETFVLSEKDVELLKIKINEFRNNILTWAYYTSEKTKNGIGVSMNVQMYSITSRK